ncbi:M20 family metallopeptidase [Planctomycetes bacterium K23_9]|uniref:Probable succinyl-diaminopimelate desuccinylase n=1 Tax=Stieleria marina TaxID=1930275 RepID=A0A517NVN2_9BACT|nr:Acetylornithine deacetylase [Planctomycetes bacterium K23_9]
MAPVLQTLADLIRINSVNPNYEGGVNESKIAGYVQAFFDSRGIAVQSADVLPGRPNVIAKVPGADADRRVVFEAHLDTVSVADMTIDPFDPVVRDGMMYGRGACDTKGGMAAMMHAVAQIASSEEPPPCEIVFAATIDEEYSYRGVVDFCEGLQADAAIIAEPTMLAPVIASKGLVRFIIETKGVAAHSAKPHLGNNAIEQMMVVVSHIAKDNEKLTRAVHPLLGSATCNIGVIRGGVQINLVPATCEIEIDRRILPGETYQSVLAGYEALLQAIMTQHPNIDAVIHPPLLTDLPLETDRESPAVTSMGDVLSLLGHDPTPIGVPFCSDASKFGAIGIPSIILGPGSIDQAHGAIEYIDCQSVVDAVEVYRQFAIRFQ